MCTRVVYTGEGSRVLTGRSMDWISDLGTNLWAFPRGIARTGAAGRDSVEWVSKYGSVVATAYDVCTTDGVNEAGLAANALWLVESQYETPTPGRKLLSIAMWAQYVLDQFATVDEAVSALAAEEFTVATGGVPGNAERLVTMHLSISDATGDSAILEYLDGALVIHHGREFPVMTNSPTFDQQLAITGYWNQVGGTVMLPGTNRAADRFARASFYLTVIPKVEDRTQAIAGVASIVRNASVPFGISTPDQPNIASTRWRTLTDHKDRRYYFESATAFGGVWVSLADLDLSDGAPTLRLPLAGTDGAVYEGDAASGFVPTEAFAFAPVAVSRS